jgi:hypothetical protein
VQMWKSVKAAGAAVEQHLASQSVDMFVEAQRQLARADALASVLQVCCASRANKDDILEAMPDIFREVSSWRVSDRQSLGGDQLMGRATFAAALQIKADQVLTQLSK